MTVSFQPVHAESLKDHAYRRLQSMLIERVLGPGQHIVETDLASRLGISRGPIREALQQLERDGWVELRPRHGAYVHDPSQTEASDFFEVRRVIEGESARLAALRGSDEANKSLGPIVRDGKRALDDDAPGGELAQLTADFHRGVTELGRNSVLTDLVAKLAARTMWYFRPLVGSISSRAWEEHAAIQRAISIARPDEAEIAARDHVEWSWQRYSAWHDW